MTYLLRACLYLFSTSSLPSLNKKKKYLSDSVHSDAHNGTMSINFCHTAAVSGTMKLVFHIFSRSKFSMEHQFHCAADTGGMAYVYRTSAAVGGGMDGIR